MLNKQLSYVMSDDLKIHEIILNRFEAFSNSVQLFVVSSAPAMFFQPFLFSGRPTPSWAERPCCQPRSQRTAMATRRRSSQTLISFESPEEENLDIKIWRFWSKFFLCPSLPGFKATDPQHRYSLTQELPPTGDPCLSN